MYPMTQVLITGSSGRMGRALIEGSAQIKNLEVASTHDVGQDLEEAFDASPLDVVVDFTSPALLESLLENAQRKQTALVIGTTGYSPEDIDAIKRASTQLPIVFAPNFSLGVNVLFWLVNRAARILDTSLFDIEVVEMHHRHKVDAPSGTAQKLLDILNEATHTGREVVSHGREGMVGPRRQGEIGMHTLRGGDVVGDHTVIFAGEGERVELTHKASSRMTFALGALRAAQWLVNQPAGLYDMGDVLNLKE